MKQEKNECTTIYLVRHGETEANRTMRIQGHGDSPLSVRGESQAKERMEKMRSIHVDHAYSSDLLRAKRTAEILVSNRNIPLSTTPSLRERGFGSYEGRLIGEFLDEHAEFMDAFDRANDEERWQFQLLGGIETDGNVRDRAFAFLHDRVTVHAGKTILCVSHAGAMRIILLHLGWGTHEEMPWGTMENCAMIRLEFDGKDFTVCQVDGVEKLSERIPPKHVIL
ncbi:MAG: histidine phosphatase family protein [Candidatus Uhrbacteria bacterium]|nr:histidine phosphatase family protein [Candidatus Uhrbacteria bacterium]